MRKRPANIPNRHILALEQCSEQYMALTVGQRWENLGDTMECSCCSYEGAPVFPYLLQFCVFCTACC